MDRADAAQYIGVPLLVVLGTIVSVFMYRLSLIEKVDKNPPPFRRNGSQLPWDSMQVLVVVAFFYIEFGFWALVSPGFTADNFNICGGIFAVLSLLITILWFWLTFTDPASNSGKTLERPDASVKFAECIQCEAFYIGSGPGTRSRRKHCGYCKRCVTGYDHHCWFLNTCVGGWNYKPFIVISTLYTMLCMYSVVVCSWAAYAYFNDTGASLFDRSALKNWVDDVYSGWAWALYLHLGQVLAGIQWAALLLLLGYHLYLTCIGETTFTNLGMEYPDEYEVSFASNLEAPNPAGPDKPNSEIMQVEMEVNPSVNKQFGSTPAEHASTLGQPDPQPGVGVAVHADPDERGPADAPQDAANSGEI